MSPTPARRVAYEVLRRAFEGGAWVDRAFRAEAGRAGIEDRKLAQAQRLAYGAVQRRGTTDHVIALLARRPADRLDAPLAAALRLGLYEVLFAAAVPDHAAVDQAVALARDAMGREPRPKRDAAAGLVNAVLRRAVRERDALLESLDDRTPEAAAIALSYPRWLAQMWWTELGASGARSLMRALNEPAETSFRINPLRADPGATLARLTEAGVRAVPAPAVSSGLLGRPDAIVVEGRTGREVAPLLERGELVAQSRASQAVAAVLEPRPGERVLDLCAGPGVKTTQLAALMGDGGEIVSVERDAGRARQIAELCGRAAVSSARSVAADGLEADLGAGYDRALVDPPCSDLGALAARPDARWRKSPEQIARLATVQRELLARAARALRPGGTVVYSTCTISVAENEEVVRAALAAEPTLRADDLAAAHGGLASPHDRRFLQIRPDRDRTDGFFIARLRRTEA